MCTIHKRKFLPIVIFRNGLICRQHKFFNNTMCIIALVFCYIDRFSFGIQCDLAFRKIKIYRSTFITTLAQNGCQLIHQFKHRYQFFIFFAILRILQFNNRMNTCVGHSTIDVDHSFLYAVFYDLSFGIDVHHTG